MRYKGIAYPLEKNVKGLFSSTDDIAQIKGSMATIIMTRPGERIMEPLFGCALHTLVNKPEELVLEEARQMIAESLKRWEKRVQVEEVQLIFVPNDRGKDINIQVLFIDPADIQLMHQLTLQLPWGS